MNVDKKEKKNTRNCHFVVFFLLLTVPTTFGMWYSLSIRPVTGTGARFSKVPVTLRARNQKFKSKYKE